MATAVVEPVVVAIVAHVLVVAALTVVAPGVLALVAASVAEPGPVLVSAESGDCVVALFAVAVVGAGVPAASVAPGVLGAVVASIVPWVVDLAGAALMS